MSLCQRCFKSQPIYDCISCKGYYCLSCDNYIHSFPNKKNHTRRMIDIKNTILTKNNYNKSIFNPPIPNSENKDINKNDIIKTTIPIYDSNIGKSTDVFNSEKLKYQEGPYIDLEEKYLQGTTNIANKIQELSSNISTTKINLNERIDSLHEHMCKADEEHKNEIINLNSRNLKEINSILTEKDGEIKRLQSYIEKQKEKINELKKINNDLELTLDNCKKIKDRCLSEKEEAFYEKKNLENFYIQSLDEMQFAQEEEKKELVKGYEDNFMKTNNDYHEDKNKFLNELRNLQATYDNMRDEHEKNIENMKMNKSRLEQENKKRDIENEQLKIEGENMQNNLRKTKTQIEEMEEEMKNFDLDNLQRAKEMESMSTKSQMIKRANTALGKSVFRSAYRPES